MSQITCSKCRYTQRVPSGQAGKPPQIFCRFNPPSVQTFIMPHPISGMPQQMSVAAFPNVEPEWWCSKGASRMETAV
jgi:hypothetical protein